jgi:general secretion pathway protein G
MGPYLKETVVPRDHWDRPLQYAAPGDENRRYEIVSWAADGQPGGEKWDRDILSWKTE